MVKILAVDPALADLTALAPFEGLTVFDEIEISFCHIHFFFKKLSDIATGRSSFILAILLNQAELAVDLRASELMILVDFQDYGI